MTAWRVFLSRVVELARHGRIARDLDDELRHHLDLLTEHHLARGLSPADARRAARLEFGSLDGATEAVRDRRGFRVLEAFRTDIVRAARRLAAAPALPAAIVIILGLGIGVNLAIVSLIDAALFRPLPYPDADRLVAIVESVSRADGETRTLAVAPANFADYRRQAADLASMAGYSRVRRNVSGIAAPDRLIGEAVMPDYFDVLGGAPRLGRTFVPAEFVEGADAVVVLSESLWRSGFGADPAALGQRLVLDGRAHDIVGVLPDSFVAVSGVGTPERAAFYVPLVYPADMMTGRGEHVMGAVGRLRPGATVEALDATLSAVARSIAATHEGAAGLDAGAAPLDHASGVVDRDAVQTLMAVLMAAVGLVLAATCANVAGLLLVRSFGRMREVGVRVALGASRARVRLEWFAEALVLAALGGGAGLVFSAVAVRLLVAVAPAGIPNLDAVGIDGRLLAVALALTLGASILIGLGPAWTLGRTAPADTLRLEGGRTTAGRALGRAWTSLLVVEVAVSAVLLVGAGLMTRSLIELNRVELGFDPDDVLALNVPLPSYRYATPASRLAFFEQAAGQLGTLPGVTAVTFANRLPLRGNWASGFFLEPAAEGAAAAEPREAGFQAVTPEYFQVFGIRATAGRLLEAADRTGAPAVAVVSRAFVDRHLDGANPIGRRFRRFPEAPWVTIVGVVGDLRRGGREAAIEPQVYLPAAQPELYPLPLAEIALRTDGRVLGGREVRQAIRAIDPDQPVTSIATVDELLALGQAERRFQAMLFALFAAMAAALATVGTYSVVATVVSERTREIGVRMALGADRVRVLGWIVARAGRPVLAGAAAGIGLAWWLSASVASLLFGVTPTDATAYATAAALLLAAGLIAGLCAGRRATRIDPVSVLK